MPEKKAIMTVFPFRNARRYVLRNDNRPEKAAPMRAREMLVAI
jgi:hypothetical protein